jgi:heme/copper-type cytochrome/quinol oxidase subunit 2
MTRHLHHLLGTVMIMKHRSATDQRGLSQSTEIAILLGAAVLVALTILAFVTGYVSDRLGEVQKP